MTTIVTDLIQQSPGGAKNVPVVVAVNADGSAIAGGGGGGGDGKVEVTNFPAEQKISGTVTVTGGDITITGAVNVDDSTVKVTGIESAGSAGIGAPNADIYSDPSGLSDGTVIGLLKGMYEQHAQMIALLTAIKDNTTPASE